MNRQDFDKWKEDEIEKYYTYYPTNDAIKTAIEKSAEKLYNLLSKEIGEKDEEIQRIKSLMKSLYQANINSMESYWQQFKTENNL